MNSQTQRRLEPPEGELVSPLSGPSYGAFAVAKRRWHKPLNLAVADALAHNRALLARLSPGLWAPPIVEDYERNEAIYRELQCRTREQITALEKFAMIDWRE
jgi:hypothetical protein